MSHLPLKAIAFAPLLLALLSDARAAEDPIAGVWTWLAGITVEIAPNGHAQTTSTPLTLVGDWTLLSPGNGKTERRYMIKWQGGQTIDDLYLSSDHRHLHGQNQFGLKIVADRLSPLKKAVEPTPRRRTTPVPEVIETPNSSHQDVVPKSATVVPLSADADARFGNIKVTFSDGHSEVLTTGGQCDLPHLNAAGDLGWNRPDRLTDDRYGRNADILHLRLHDGSVKEFKPNVLYIMDWGFATNDTEVVIKSMGHHGPSSFVKYNIQTGRVTGEVLGYHPEEELPKWARGFGE